MKHGISKYLRACLALPKAAMGVLIYMKTFYMGAYGDDDVFVHTSQIHT